MTRFVLGAAAAVAIMGFSALAPANAADAIYIQGGPSQHDGMCQVATDGYGSFGYVTPCPRPTATMRHSKKMK